MQKAAGELVPEETGAHHLRHTFARSYLAQYPGDLVGLATLLGHSSLDTTRLYSNHPLCNSQPALNTSRSMRTRGKREVILYEWTSADEFGSPALSFIRCTRK